MRGAWIAGWMAVLLGLLGRDAPTAESKKARPAPLEVRTERFQDASFHVVTVDLDRASLRLLRQDEKGRAFETFAELNSWLDGRGEHLLAATNAGIFEPGQVPTGLFIQDSQQLAPLNLKQGQGNFYWKPNGIFLVGPNGAQVVDASGYRADSKTRQATQSGPLLLVAGEMHPGFASSKGLAVRSGVGVDARNPKRVHIVLSGEPVRLETFASFFRMELGCADALYLDGNISRLYPASLQGGNADTGGKFSGFLAVTVKK